MLTVKHRGVVLTPEQLAAINPKLVQGMNANWPVARLEAECDRALMLAGLPIDEIPDIGLDGRGYKISHRHKILDDAQLEALAELFKVSPDRWIWDKMTTYAKVDEALKSVVPPSIHVIPNGTIEVYDFLQRQMLIRPLTLTRTQLAKGVKNPSVRYLKADD